MADVMSNITQKAVKAELEKVAPKIVEELKDMVKDLIKDADPSKLEIGTPCIEPRRSNRNNAYHNIIVIPVRILDDKNFAVMLGGNLRNKTKFEDQLTGYANGLTQKVIPSLRVRIDLDPSVGKDVVLRPGKVTHVKIEDAVKNKIIEDKSPIWKFYQDDKVWKMQNLKEPIEKTLTIEHHTDLIGPSIHLAILAGYLANYFQYSKIVDLFCGSGSTTSAIMGIHKSSAQSNIICIDSKIDASIKTLKTHTCATVMLEEDIMKFLSKKFLSQNIEFIVADPPHSMVYPFLYRHIELIAKHCELFLIYISHKETKKWVEFIISMLERQFEVYKITAADEVMAICIPREKLSKLSEHEKKLSYYNLIRNTLDHYRHHMENFYGQIVDYSPQIPFHS